MPRCRKGASGVRRESSKSAKAHRVGSGGGRIIRALAQKRPRPGRTCLHGCRGGARGRARRPPQCGRARPGVGCRDVENIRSTVSRVVALPRRGNKTGHAGSRRGGRTRRMARSAWNVGKCGQFPTIHTVRKFPKNKTGPQSRVGPVIGGAMCTRTASCSVHNPQLRVGTERRRSILSGRKPPKNPQSVLECGAERGRAPWIAARMPGAGVIPYWDIPLQRAEHSFIDRARPSDFATAPITIRQGGHPILGIPPCKRRPLTS